MSRYTYRRLSTLPFTDEGLRRLIDLNGQAGLPGVSIRHATMKPGADVPVATDQAAQLIVTLSGRGVLLLDGDRLEVSASEVVFVPAGCPCGLQTLGGTNWVHLMIRSAR